MASKKLFELVKQHFSKEDAKQAKATLNGLFKKHFDKTLPPAKLNEFFSEFVGAKNSNTLSAILDGNTEVNHIYQQYADKVSQLPDSISKDINQDPKKGISYKVPILRAVVQGSGQGETAIVELMASVTVYEDALSGKMTVSSDLWLNDDTGKYGTESQFVITEVLPSGLDGETSLTAFLVNHGLKHQTDIVRHAYNDSAIGAVLGEGCMQAMKLENDLLVSQMVFSSITRQAVLFFTRNSDLSVVDSVGKMGDLQQTLA